jgi:hypothetical protein
MPGTVADVNVSLFGLSTRSSDIDILLMVGRSKIILLSDVGGTNGIPVDLVFGR